MFPEKGPSEEEKELSALSPKKESSFPILGTSALSLLSIKMIWKSLGVQN